MKTKTHFIALLILALFASCQSKRVQKDEKMAIYDYDDFPIPFIVDVHVLSELAKDNDAAEVQRLIAGGYDVNAKNYLGETALMIAAQNNSADVARLLLEAGADVKATDEYGNTALMWAAGNNSLDAARLLLAAGADINAKDNSGKTALMWAADNGATNVAELLEAAGAR